MAIGSVTKSVIIKKRTITMNNSQILVALLSLTFSLSSSATDKTCDYNDWAGDLIAEYKKPGEKIYKEDIGWAPVQLRVCETDEGKKYVIITHKAISLGYLSNPPLELSNENLNQDFATTHGYRGEEGVFELFKSNKSIKAVIAFTDSAEYIKVYRKELSRTYSETLKKVFVKDDKN